MWDFPLFPEQASTAAPRVDALYFGVVAVSLAFTLAFAVAVIFFAIKYRAGSSADRSNIKESDPIAETLYIAVPTLLGIGLFLWGAIEYFDLISPPGDATEMYVVGKQWMWKVQHPQGKSEINELHVPLGRPIKLTMSSQDVIHSYYIPAFRVKQDVMPGKYTSLWFEPTMVGRFRLFCTEYCGSEHSQMGGWVTVMEPEDYEAWLSEGPRNTALAIEGQQLFKQYHCSGCHGGDSNTGERAVVRAPNLEGVYGGPVPIQVGDKVELIRADDRYVRDSILKPADEVVAGYKPLMPSFAGQINEDELLKIMAYIKSIGRGSGRRALPDYDRRGEDALPEITRRMGAGR